MDGMIFLNEFIESYPDAVSFASGRPRLSNFDYKMLLDCQAEFSASLPGLNGSMAARKLCQYGQTRGIIGEILAKYLSRDKKILAANEDIVVTNGAQEALIILVNALCRSSRDAVLVVDPTYVGIIGACKELRVPVYSVSHDGSRVLVEALNETVQRILSDRGNPRVLYLVSNYYNPHGIELSHSDRLKVLELCNQNNILLIEDNTYGKFCYSEVECPSFRTLDMHGIVFYIGSFSKLVCPTMRIGYLVVPSNRFEYLDLVVRSKSYFSLNTNQFTQAVIGGLLIKNDYSLQAYIQGDIAHYRNNKKTLDLLVTSRIAETQDIQYYSPNGGFFSYLALKRPFGLADAKECAKKHGVLVVPLQLFSMTDNYLNYMRLSFSNVEQRSISVGVLRLFSYLNSL